MDISKHFSYKRLMRYTVSSSVMMVFTSIYGVVDGLFVSNYAGKTAFAAVNLVFPFLMILGGTGFMFGTGGSALVEKAMGEGENLKANQIFLSLVYASLITGVFLTVLGFFLLRPVAVILGAEGQLLEDSISYGRIYLLGVPLCIVQYELHNLFPTSGKPKLGLYSTLVSGFGNVVLELFLWQDFPWAWRVQPLQLY